MNILAVLLTYTLTFPAQQNISISIVENNTPANNLVFIAPHENESVANDYLRQKIKTNGGKFLELRQNGNRLINLNLADNRIKIDPNRIFTPRGRKTTLRKLNPSLKNGSQAFQKALTRTQQLAEFILTHLDEKTSDSKIWVAMHNNTNGYTGDGKGGDGTISIIRYKKKLASGAKFLIKVNQDEHDEDDLFYVTQAADFEQMKKDGWNVILENPIVKTDVDEDDGSLSVFANKSGVRYINIETERESESGGKDHIQQKRNMIDYVYSIAKEK